MRPVTTSVTALRFITLKDSTNSESFSTLFAGIANQVRVYRPDSDQPPITARVLPDGERIHGFSEGNENRVIVHGGRFAVVITANLAAGGSSGGLVVGEPTELNDWVWGSQWIERGRFLALACGHSTVAVCDSTDLCRNFRVQCVERELTWSTTLFISASRASLRAVAGTSFGDVLAWTVLDQATDEHVSLKLRQLQDGVVSQANARERKPAHRSHVHDGPIMKLKVSPDARRMVSASVDRSVRVWQRSTSAQCSICGSDGCFVPVLCHYGHLARVWDVSFLEFESLRVVSGGEDRSCRVWSGTVAGQQMAVFHGHAGRNIWSLDVRSAHDTSALVATGGEDGSIKLRSFDIPAADMNQSVTNDHAAISCASRKCISGSFKLPGNCANPRKSGRAYNESGRTLLLLTNELLFVSTDFGRILCAKISSGKGQTDQPLSASAKGVLLDDSVSWSELYRDNSGTAYTPSSLAFCDGLLFGGQTHGDVTVLRLSGVPGGVRCAAKVATIPVFLHEKGMVMGIFTQKSLDNRVYNLFAATSSGDLYHWQLEERNGGEILNTFCQTYRQRNPTKSALVTSVLYLSCHGVVIVGDRGGRVLLYDATAEDLSFETFNGRIEKNQKTVLPFSVCRPHRDRVSSISTISVDASKRTVGQDAITVYDLVTTGFDGRCAQLQIRVAEYATGERKREMSVTVLSSQKSIEHVDTIAKIAFPRVPKRTIAGSEGTRTVESYAHGKYCIIGFRSADVTIWDVKQRNEIFRTNCGNWRRAFDTCLDLTYMNTGGVVSRLTVERMTVAFWRSGRLYIVQTLDESQDTQQTGHKEGEPRSQSSSMPCTSQADTDNSVQSMGVRFHGQRANAVSWIEGSDVLLTASEDTTINVAQLRNGDWDITQTLSRHISGVNSLSTTRISEQLLVTFSGGGSDEMVTWLATDAKGPWKDVCAVTIGGTRRERKALQRVTCVGSIDGRFCRDSPCGMVVVGRSDGSVALVRSAPLTGERYSQAGREWRCEVLQVSTEQHCGAVLCCSTTTTRIAGHDALVAVTGDSRGTVVVWVVVLAQKCEERRLQVVRKMARAHDGGVNAIAVRVDVDRVDATLVVVSGGDDERVRVHMTPVKWKGNENDRDKDLAENVQEYKTVWESPLGMHSAAVTGVSFAVEEQEESREGDLNWVVAVSGADQRVNWLQLRRRRKQAPRTEWEIRHLGEASARVSVPDVAAIAARTRRVGDKGTGVAVVAGCGQEAVHVSWAIAK